MGQKIHPVAVRLNINRTFDASWFDDNYKNTFHKEQLVRKAILAFFGKLAIYLPNIILGRIFYQRSHQKTIISFFIYKLKKKKNRSRRFFYSSKNSCSISNNRHFVDSIIDRNNPLNLFQFKDTTTSNQKFLKALTEFKLFKPLPSLNSNKFFRPKLVVPEVGKSLVSTGLHTQLNAINNVRSMVFLRNSKNFLFLLTGVNKPNQISTSGKANFKDFKSILFPTPKKTYSNSLKCHPLFYRLEESLTFLFCEHVYLQPIVCRTLSNSAVFLAKQIALIIEKNKKKRMPYKQINRLIQFTKNGIRIQCSGRLGGAEMAKTFFLKKGQTSLNIFSQKIDFAYSTALTKYGIIGIKVWICYG